MKRSLGANTIVYPAPVFVVGTYDEEGKPNIMAAAWAGICCSSPPCVAVSLRAATYSHGSIMKKKAFTVNIPSEDHAAAADYAGMFSGEDRNKFDVLGLTPVRSKFVDAPYVKEFPLVLECNLIHVFELGLHTQFVGQIMDAKVDEEIIGEKGVLDVKMIKPILYDPSNGDYYGLGRHIGKAYSMGRELEVRKEVK